MGRTVYARFLPPVDDRPIIDPFQGEKEGLAPELRVDAVLRPNSQKDSPPSTIRTFDHIHYRLISVNIPVR